MCKALQAETGSRIRPGGASNDAIHACPEAAIPVNVQDGYTVRDQVMCDLLHLFDITLRAYKPLQAAEGSLNRQGSACACAPEQPCSCRPAAGLKLSHLQADAQVGPPHTL